MTIDFTMWLIIALCASVGANIFAFWYIYRVLIKLFFVSENLSDLVAIINNYKDHLKTIHEMEQYYGDETVRFLIAHTNSLLDILKEYEDIYSIVEENKLELLEIEEEPEQDAETPINQENVFYAGTRERDT